MVDPGWLPAVHLVPRGLFLPLLFGTARSEPRIVVMRAAFIAVVGGQAVVLLAAPAVADARDRSLSPAVAAALVVGSGVWSIAGSAWIERRFRRPGISVENVAASYQASFVLRVAFGVVPMLAGLLAVELSGASWTVLIGLPFAVLALVRAAPTTATLARDEQRINAGEGPGWLLPALLRPASPG